MTRETIYAALFAKLSAADGFVTVSRKVRHWDDVPQSEQPALFQSQKKEVPTNSTAGLDPVWNFTLDVFLYVHTQGDKTIVPSTILNGLVDAVLVSIAPEPVSNKQTLGGLVQHVWIDGAIVTDEGVLGDQAVAIIPITIKVV